MPVYLVILFLVQSVAAWGYLGHELIAQIATSRLAQHTINSIAPILKNQSLVSVSTWADKIKFSHPWSRKYHYASPSTCIYDQKRDCNDGKCIVAQVWNMTLQVQSIKSDKRHSMRLKSYHKIKNTIQTIKNIKVNNSKKYVRKGRSVRIPFDLKEMQTREEKDKKSKETGDNLEDVLKFLVHFIGDLGQPLHVCGRSYGGNGVLVNFDKLKRINLHSIWDSTILKKRILEFKGVNEYITYLESISSKLNETVDLSQNQVLKWTRDTQHMDCTMVWKAFDENPDQNFGDAYYEEQKHNVDLQLAKSGFRLGKWLDLLFTLKRTRKMAYKDAEDEDEDDTELVDKGKNEDNNGDFSNEEKVKDNNSDSMNKENDFRDETVESNVVKVEVDSLRKSPRLQIEQKKDAPKRKFTTIQDNDSLSRQSDENTLEDDQDQPKRKILKVKHSETKNKETSENVYHIKDKAITNLRKSPRFQ